MNSEEKADNIEEIIKLKNESDKRMLLLEIVIGILSVSLLLICVFMLPLVNLSNIYKVFLFIFVFIIFLISAFICLWLEQIAGYYECRQCHNKYIPSYKSVLFAMHICRTRYMKCPKCNKYSWNKKTIK